MPHLQANLLAEGGAWMAHLLQRCRQRQWGVPIAAVMMPAACCGRVCEFRVALGCGRIFLMSWQYHQRWWIAHRFDQWNLQALQCTISEFYVFRDCNIKITSPNFTQESEFGWNWYDSIPSSLNTFWTSPGYIHFKGVWVSHIWVTFGNAIPLNEQVYGHNLISHDSWHVIIIGVTCQTHPNCWLLSPWLSISIKLTPHSNVPLAVPGSSGGGPGAQSRNHLLHVEVWRSIDAPHVGRKTWETQLKMPLKGRPFHHVWDLLNILSPPPSPAVVQECQGLQLFIFILQVAALTTKSAKPILRAISLNEISEQDLCSLDPVSVQGLY